MHHWRTATAQAAQRKRRQPPLVALWLILATVFAHALLPVGSPMSRTSGSAFSATTAEVSLAPGRDGDSSLVVRQGSGSNAGSGGPDPVQWPAALLPAPASVAGFAVAPAPARPTEPDLQPRPAQSRPYSPRAPPLP